jgi:hypothetical protein
LIMPRHLGRDCTVSGSVAPDGEARRGARAKGLEKVVDLYGLEDVGLCAALTALARNTRHCG